MAKSKSFFGLRKGSTKTMTFSVLRGQQITKDRVTDIANPRTMDQTLQRIPFAQAVKFYKQATAGLFRFAYEDKKPLESDYNAFMRHNVKYASSVTNTNYRNVNYPSIGNYLLSAGSLTPADYHVSGSMLLFGLEEADDDYTTVGALSTFILNKYHGLVEGDIVTMVAFVSSVDATGVLLEQAKPEMHMIQFEINKSSSVTLNSLGLDDIVESTSYIAWDILQDNRACAGAVIFSRNTPNGLLVSDANLSGSTVWNTLLTNGATKLTREGNAYTWGAAEKAILQGSLAD